MMGLSLSGTMIPRKIRRYFDQRCEERREPECTSAMLEWRGEATSVTLCNLSSEGAMISFASIPNIGEPVTLQLLDRSPVRGQVRWVRDGRIGINFLAPME